jgi:hypothetical protein
LGIRGSSSQMARFANKKLRIESAAHNKMSAFSDWAAAVLVEVVTEEEEAEEEGKGAGKISLLMVVGARRASRLEA